MLMFSLLYCGAVVCVLGIVFALKVITGEKTINEEFRNGDDGY